MVSSQLFKPGSCIVKNCIYIIGGEIMIPNYTKSYNKNIYKFDLDALTIFNLNIFGVICNFPKCIGSGDDIIVLGVSPQNMRFVQSIGQNTINPKELTFKFNEEQSLQKINNEAVIFSRKKIKRLRLDKFLWKFEVVNSDKIKDGGIICNLVNDKPRCEVPKKVILESRYFEENNKTENIQS